MYSIGVRASPLLSEGRVCVSVPRSNALRPAGKGRRTTTPRGWNWPPNECSRCSLRRWLSKGTTFLWSSRVSGSLCIARLDRAMGNPIRSNWKLAGFLNSHEKEIVKNNLEINCYPNAELTCKFGEPAGISRHRIIILITWPPQTA